MPTTSTNNEHFQDNASDTPHTLIIEENLVANHLDDNFKNIVDDDFDDNLDHDFEIEQFSEYDESN